MLVCILLSSTNRPRFQLLITGGNVNPPPASLSRWNFTKRLVITDSESLQLMNVQ